MFNLLVSSAPWEPQRDTLPVDRVFQYTESDVLARLTRDGRSQLEAVRDLPALFVEETDTGSVVQFARVGRILSARSVGKQVHIEYFLEPDVPPIPQALLIEMAPSLSIDMPQRGWNELQTTHWAVKDHDLYKELFHRMRAPSRAPKVFSLPATQRIDRQQVAAMMPFAGFGPVYEAIVGAAEDNQMRCNRADDIWENHAIMDDIVALIDRSAVVVCDCTGRNPNVFYEIGLAHAIGKDVILITQSGDDVPFDLKQFRYITYLNNGEGLAKLRVELGKRIGALCQTASL